jgi:hypothetical protein
MSLLGSVGNATKGLIGNSLLPGIGFAAGAIDPTPGFSATNVIRTQLGKLGSADSPASSGGGGNIGTWGTGAQGTAPSGAYQSSGAATPSYTAGVNDPATLAQYDQGIGNTQAALGRLGDQFNSGNSQIDASYQNAINQLLLGKNQANTAYDTNKHQTATDYVSSKNTIGANAGSSLNGLQRLLGSRGAGGGSAATIAAPGAVTRQATIQRGQASNTFGANNQALDTNWNNYLTGYNNEVSSAGNQRDTQRQQLQQSVDNNRATLLQTLASLSGQRSAAQGGNGAASAQPYLDQANSVLDHLANYNVSPINYQTQAYQAPDLAQYIVNPNATPTFQGEAQTSDYTSPYLAALLGKKQQSLAPA